MRESSKKSSAVPQTCHFYSDLHAVLDSDATSTPHTTVYASEEPKMETPSLNSEEEERGDVMGDSSNATSQDLFETQQESNHSYQASAEELLMEGKRAVVRVCMYLFLKRFICFSFPLPLPIEDGSWPTRKCTRQRYRLFTALLAYCEKLKS